MSQETTPPDALAECEARFRVLMEFSADWYWEQDEQLHFTMFTGKSAGPAESFARVMIGKAAWELPQLLNADDENWVRYRALTGERREFRDLRLSRIDAKGRTRHFNVSGQPMFDSAGGFRGYRGVGRDITAEHAATEALRRNEAHLQLFAENIQQVLWIVDIDERRTVYVSPAYESVWKRPRESLLADPTAWMEAVHPEDRERVRIAAGHVTDGDYSVEYRILWPDGSERWIHDRAFAVPRQEGEPRRMVGISRDFTERKNAYEAIRALNSTLEQKVAERTAVMEAALRELESFCYSISHDLRSPLRAIHGYSRILLDEHAPLLNDEGRDLLGRVSRATLQMSEMIDSLLALARVSFNEISWEAVDLGAMARQIAIELRDSAPDRAVVFRIDEDARASGDPALLRIVLHNLLDNAWKYTSRVPRAQIEFSVASTPEGPAFYVRDNGAGFDMEHSARLFGAFQRLHSPREFEGTGIGLASAQRIIRHHRGRIWADSAPNRGATFYFTLGGP